MSRDEDIKKIVKETYHDLNNQSRESMVSTFNNLFLSHKEEVKDILTEQTEKLLKSVDNKIETKVNGSIRDFRKENADMYEKLMTEIGTLKTETKPATLITSGAKTTFKVILWGAVSISTIGGAYLVLINIFK